MKFLRELYECAITIGAWLWEDDPQSNHIDL